MNIFLLYMLKVNIVLTVLYLFYVLFCTRDTFFRLRRTALLMCCTIAFIAPVVHLPADSFLFRRENPVNLGVIYEKIWTDTPEVLIQDTLVTVTQTTIPTLVKFLFVIYLTGALVLLLRTGMELRHTFLLFIQSKKQCIQGVTVWIHPDNRSPFSFFRWICIGKDLTERQELSEVLIHEQTHVRCLHSIDMVLAQMVIVCCWFNPAAWLLRREIRVNHEYEADDTVMKAGFNKKSYQYHLIGMEYTPMAAANIYNNFSVLPLKKRLKMMNKKRTRNLMKSKYVMFLPMAILLMSFTGIRNQSTFAVPFHTEEMTEIFEATEILQTPAEDEEILHVVDEMPQYPGGVKELMKYISENLRYPREAADAAVQGRVMVQMVVRKDGSIDNVRVVRGVHEALDQEAVRVIKGMPTWQPGKHEGKVRNVYYTIPVEFRL